MIAKAAQATDYALENCSHSSSAFYRRIRLNRLAVGQSGKQPNNQTQITFSDCALCREMVILPAGSFDQGDLKGAGDEDERPVFTVVMSTRIAMARTEVTYRQWDQCVRVGRCEALPEETGDAIKRVERPVQNVSWNDTRDFLAWLTDVSGHAYRLATESEFEYAARAGTKTRFSWGDEPSRDYANYGTDVCCGGHAEGMDKWFSPGPVGSFPANAFGLRDMAGNVQEWVEDCWSESYGGPVNCEFRVLRGGSWSSVPKMIRPANRDKGPLDVRLPYYGFRVVRDL